MKTDDIHREILEIPTPGEIVFTRSESTFVNPFTPAQVDAIVKSSRNWGRVVDNSTGIRLNAVFPEVDGSSTVLDLAPVRFNDFVSTNLLLMGNPLLDRAVAAQVRHWVEDHASYEEVLADSTLANLLTVSLLISDDRGKLGIAERSEHVAVNPGACGVTVTATPNLGDYHSEDPFLSCVRREAMEELNLDELKDIEFRGLIIGRQKLQPVALYDARIEGFWEDQSPEFKNAPDFDFEVKNLLALSEEQLFDSMETRDYTVVARYQIAKHFNLL
jgi:hypothetical protein